MNGYQIPDDGKLHVNYSGLKRCTSTKGVMAVIEEMNGGRTPFDGETVQIGKIRHAQWERESKATGRTPVCFKEQYDQPLDFIEQSFATEIFKDVVLHFRPDSVSLADQAIVDYKKVVKGAYQFHNDWQLKIYAYALQLHGHKIKRLVHLCEVWDRDMNSPKIIGYQALVRQVNLADIALAPQWLRLRAGNLKKAQSLLTY